MIKIYSFDNSSMCLTNNALSIQFLLTVLITLHSFLGLGTLCFFFTCYAMLQCLLNLPNMLLNLTHYASKFNHYASNFHIKKVTE